MNKQRDHIKQIYLSAIGAVDPISAVKNHVTYKKNTVSLYNKGELIKQFDLEKYKNIYVIGAGKATASMALAIEQILGEKITSGTICVKYKHSKKLQYITTIEAAHPVPDENGLKAARVIRSIAEQASVDDLIISLISGGGSALLPFPPEPITLDEKKTTTDLLLKSGASIHEINCIRKHLSLVKGGNLASAAFPATVINLMISDVVGDNMDVIASGPFLADNSTFKMAKETLDKYSLTDTVPASVKNHILSGANDTIPENPQPRMDIFNNVTNLIIASNIIALQAAYDTARSLGYNPMILSSAIEGDTAATAHWHIAIARESLNSSHPIKPPACIISGGETTVQVKGSGLGGRNMEFCIQAAPLLRDLPNITIASVGTDGTDGPTDAAGAICDSETISRSEKKGLDIENYIYNNDSYMFFKELGDLVMTGPTNTNVMDIRIILIS